MTEHEHQSFGKYLKTERMLRGIGLEEIAVATKIKLEYLHAIEEDTFEILPNETFVKGYIRAYSKYCGLNEDDVLVNYEFFEQQKRCGGGIHRAQEDEAKRKPEHRQRTVFLLLILLSILFSIAFAALYRYFAVIP